mgnify:CR=1 FL=1
MAGARRAGVGKGTLYRRFPTKEALVRAIFEDILDELDAISRETDSEPDAQAAFARFLNGAARMQANNQGFYDVVAQLPESGYLLKRNAPRSVWLTVRKEF